MTTIDQYQTLTGRAGDLTDPEAWRLADVQAALLKAALELESGRHGSFAAHIGAAFVAADAGNRARLLVTFEGLFERGLTFSAPRRLTN